MMTEIEAKKPHPVPKWVWAGLAGLVIVMMGLVVVWGNGRSGQTIPSGSIIYLGWVEDEQVNQLYLVHPNEGEPIRLTETTQGITSFAVSPDGTLVAYSVATDDGNADIWLMNADGSKQKTLLACETALCMRPVWAADNRRVIVERRLLSGEGVPPEAPHLWWLDTQTGETLPVFADAKQTGMGAGLSPDNEWLSYTVPEAQEIRVTHLATGESISAFSQTGEPAVWYPDGEALLISDMVFQGESFSQHLFKLDLASAELTNISGEEIGTNDGLPVFSPNGEWVVFGRKKPRAPMGKQLWLMRPDGSEAISLTEDADVHFNNPGWSPDGTQLVVQGFNQAAPELAPALWVVDVETGEMAALVSPGILPVWLP
jgi:Tol biopolymer transport system component